MRPALTYAPDDLASRDAWIAECGEAVAGFFVFATIDGARFLDDFWIDPPFIGRGIGTQVWRRAVATALARGDTAFYIESDPHAEGFYLRMGAARVGERQSPATGRMLPLLRYERSRRLGTATRANTQSSTNVLSDPS